MPGQSHFPPAMDRCVMHVMDQGHPKDSAYAICRDSLGLTEGQDGSTMETTEIEARLKRNPEYMKRMAAPSPEMTKQIDPGDQPKPGEPADPEKVARAKRTAGEEDVAVEAAIPQRKDVNPQSGENKYGPDTSTPFADEVNNKYPLDTEAHVRSAWNYIHQADNAAKYPADALAKIRSRIVSAWKDKIDPAGPPSAEQKPKAAAEIPTLPVIVKDVIVAREGKNFRNGTQEFDLTRANIDEIIRNFSFLGKQVPLILAETHAFGGKRSALPASGWVESMYRAAGDWHAVVKLIGDAAVMVANDQFRGVSIGTVMARDVHGAIVGEALDHLLITNAPFFPHLNIAASESATGLGEVRYFTTIAPTGERKPMSEITKTAEDKTAESIVKTLQTEAIAKDASIRALEGKVGMLQETIDNQQATILASASPAEKKSMQEEIVRLKTVVFATQVRSLVAHGLNEGRFLPVWTKGYEGKNTLDHDGTLNWLRSSRFYDANSQDADASAFQFLKAASEMFPVQLNLNKQYPSGTPLPMQTLQMNEDEKKLCLRMGTTPEQIAALDNVVSFETWRTASVGQEKK